MGLLLFSLAFAATFLAARKSLGAGLSALFAVGYLSGVLRANYLGVFTTLMYDAAVAGIYVSSLHVVLHGDRADSLRGYVAALIAWPTLLMLVPVHDPLIQLVGLRAEAWYLPLLLFGAALKHRDLQQLSLSIALLNLLSLAVSVYIYHYGVEALYPHNAVTDIIYKSRDVAGGYHRIPSTFLNSQAYGGSMVLSLPVLLGGMANPSLTNYERAIRASGVVAAISGVILCASRLPVAILVVGTFISWYQSGVSFRFLLWATLGAITSLFVAASNPRLQRFFDLSDPDAIVERTHGSLHEGTIGIFANYPLGAGLGAGAPSIPYFLQDRAPPSVMVENEFARLVIDIGWIGLIMWVALLLWLYSRPLPPPAKTSLGWTALFARGMTLAAWASGMIGIGMLVAVPASGLLLIMMGLVAQPYHQKVRRLAERECV